jgi:hypothetical protein
MILDLFGYGRHGEIKECNTTLEKNALNTRDVALAALGFNAPAWIAATSMSLLYSAGAEPAEPKDKYQAWYIGVAVLISGALIVMLGRSSKRSADGGITRERVQIP